MNAPQEPPQQRLEDAYIGARIADDYLDGFLHAGAFGWMRFDGRRWERVPDATVGEVIRLGVIEFCQAAAAQALADEDTDRLKKIAALLSAHRLRSIQWVARGHLHVRGEDFDQHPDLLNVRNGVVDLHTGELLPHDPQLLLTKVCPVDYKSDAAHEDWRKALLALAADVVGWLQIRMGQGLSGHPTPDDAMVVLRGSGENGKTTIVDGVRGAVGADYAVTLPERVLLARIGDHPTELMTLRGERLALMEEFPELGHLNVKRLKDTHGSGVMTARSICKDPVSWPVTHTIFVTTNYLPRVDESDHGTWRRLLLVEFPYRYRKPHEAMEEGNDRRGDQRLRERMRHGVAQHEAVLAWLVKGAIRWYQDDQVMPEPPESVAVATDTWRRSVDLLLRYMIDNLIFDEQHHVRSKELYEDFSRWLNANGHTGWSDQNFTARFEQHPVVKKTAAKREKVRSSLKGLSRPAGNQPFTGPPRQYWAWVGVRFRYPDDVDDDCHDLQEEEV